MIKGMKHAQSILMHNRIAKTHEADKYAVTRMQKNGKQAPACWPTRTAEEAEQKRLMMEKQNPGTTYFVIDI